MKTFLEIIGTITLIIGFMFIIALVHETDMKNNCIRTGEARAFIVEIKCSEMKLNN